MVGSSDVLLTRFLSWQLDFCWQDLSTKSRLCVKNNWHRCSSGGDFLCTSISADENVWKPALGITVNVAALLVWGSGTNSLVRTFRPSSQSSSKQVQRWKMLTRRDLLEGSRQQKNFRDTRRSAVKSMRCYRAYSKRVWTKTCCDQFEADWQADPVRSFFMKILVPLHIHCQYSNDDIGRSSVVTNAQILAIKISPTSSAGPTGLFYFPRTNTKLWYLRCAFHPDQTDGRHLRSTSSNYLVLPFHFDRMQPLSALIERALNLSLLWW